MRKYQWLYLIPLLLLLSGCSYFGAEEVEETNWVMEWVVKLGIGLFQFAWGLLLIFWSVKFHLYLMNKFKRQFFRDEIVQAMNRLKDRKSKPTLNDIYRDAAIVVGGGAYQGLVFLGILHLMASIQTPFG